MENNNKFRLKQYDSVFTKKYAWNNNLDILVKRALINNKVLINTSKKSDVEITDLINSEVLEIECCFEDYKDEDFNCLKRALVKYSKDDKVYAAICIFDYAGTIKLVKVSEVDENFNSNIDRNEVEWNLENQKFGYFYNNDKSEVIQITPTGTKKLESDVAMTIEKWNEQQEKLKKLKEEITGVKQN